MKFLFAPDSFKGSLSAAEITRLLTKAAREIFPDAAVCSLPVADGGEGTTAALVSHMGGEYVSARVTGPTGDAIDARYGILPDGTAVIEMAAASGLPLVPDGLRNPLYTTSYGTGELIVHALEAGASRLLIGLGGSATNDGGMGILSALGARFLDRFDKPVEPVGAELGRVVAIDLAHLHPALAHAELTVLSDVTNPLLGETGATMVYGPQKGADRDALARLETGMAHYADCFYEALHMDIAGFPGAGAAGGAGAALAGVLNARICPGIEAILDLVDFDRMAEGTALVVTGEGRVDAQTAKYGKVPAGVIRRAARLGIPTAVLTGAISEGAQALEEMGAVLLYPIADGPISLSESLRRAPELVYAAARRLFQSLKIGQSIGENR